MFESLKILIPQRTARGAGAVVASLVLSASAAAHTVNESVLPYQARASYPEKTKTGIVPGRAEAPPPNNVDAGSDDPDTAGQHGLWLISPERFAQIPFYARLLRLW